MILINSINSDVVIWYSLFLHIIHLEDQKMQMLTGLCYLRYLRKNVLDTYRVNINITNVRYET